jgi:hypothetical protein
MGTDTGTTPALVFARNEGVTPTGVRVRAGME